MSVNVFSTPIKIKKIKKMPKLKQKLKQKLSKFIICFYLSQLFRKLSISKFQPAENEINKCDTKYEPQKNQTITISPIYGKKTVQIISTINQKEQRKSRNNFSDDEQEDDLSNNSTTKRQKRHFKNCIKKRLNNNYEKQINSANDENILFTDNKVYISLNGCNSSISSSLVNDTNLLKKNRRVIYPTSGTYKVSGFLRDCDFNYDYKNEAIANDLVEEKLKFNLIKKCSEAVCDKNVVFEKVKYVSSKERQAAEETHNSNSFILLHLKSSFMYDDTNNSYSTFIDGCNFNQEEPCCGTDEEDDLQWNTFMEHRKHCNNIKSKGTIEINNNLIHTIKLNNDSGFGSQLFLPSSNTIEKNLRNLETFLDDEVYDNSFNEELERRVQVEFPELYRNFNSEI